MIELVAILAAHASNAAPPITVIEGSYAISAVIGVGLIMAGVWVLRHGSWRGWPRFLPLALGIYVFVSLTPALSGPFVAGRIAIMGCMLLFALLGSGLLTSEEAS